MVKFCNQKCKFKPFCIFNCNLTASALRRKTILIGQVIGALSPSHWERSSNISNKKLLYFPTPLPLTLAPILFYICISPFCEFSGAFVQPPAANRIKTHRLFGIRFSPQPPRPLCIWNYQIRWLCSGRRERKYLITETSRKYILAHT